MNFLNRYHHFFFATKVWLTSAILTPLCFFWLPFFKDIGTLSEVFLLMVAIGIILSIPIWLIFILTIWIIQKNHDNTFDKKILINAFAVLLTLTLFYVSIPAIGFREIVNDLPLVPWGYIGVLTFSIWFYKLKNSATPFALKDDILDNEFF